MSPTEDAIVRFQAPEMPDLGAIGAYFGEAERIRWFSNRGPCQRTLEDRIAARLGGDVEVVPVANATLGLLVALRATAGRPAGGRDLVAVPSFTFVATAAAVDWCGFTPLFVDVDPASWHLDPDALDEVVAAHHARLAGVVAVSTFGAAPPPARRQRWERTCREAGVALVVDSAAGFGAIDDDGRPLGRQGDAEVFSFHATKPFGIGEGGVVTTTSAPVADRLRSLTNFGFDPDRGLGAEIGINAKLSELQAATALAVLDRFDEILAARRQRSAAVAAALEPVGYRFQAGFAGSTHQFVPVAAPTPAARAALVRLAHERGIEVRRYYEPLLHTVPAFAAAPVHGALAHTRDLHERLVCLPMANDLSPAHVDAVIRLGIDALDA